MESSIDPHQMLRRVSRTFALSIDQLPGILCDAVTVAYLMFRVSDILEDHPDMPATRKLGLLRTWADILSGSTPVAELVTAVADLDGNDPEVEVAQHADGVLDLFASLPAPLQQVIGTHVRDTTIGMARWQDHGPRVRDEEEMDDYMHEVAGRVGWLLTDIFSWYTPAIARHHEHLMHLGREFGLALQTVNIIRGLPRDYQRGWVFVPETYMQQAGLDRTSFFDPANSAQALAVVDLLTAKAERHLRNGLEYITLLPRRFNRIRLFCIWPLLFAVKTLAISRQCPSVLTTEAKITRPQVKRIVVLSSCISRSNWALTRYYHHLLQSP